MKGNLYSFTKVITIPIPGIKNSTIPPNFGMLKELSFHPKEWLKRIGIQFLGAKKFQFLSYLVGLAQYVSCRYKIIFRLLSFNV